MIDIILPTYNCEKTISKTIDSILDQSYSKWRLIIVDDGSKDKTEEIIKNYKKNNPQIECLFSKHVGAAGARNVGLDHVKNDYVAFVDSDDWLDKNYFLYGINSIESNDADIAIYDYYRVIGSNYKLSTVKTGIFNSYTACWNKLYKAKLWKNIRFPKNLTVEDVCVIPVVVGLARKKRIKVKNTYYYYLMNPDSVTHKTNVKVEYEAGDAVKLLKNNLKKYRIHYSTKEYSTFVNDFLYWHLISGLKVSSTNQVKKIFYKKFIPNFEKMNNKIVFSGSNKAIMRKTLVMRIFHMNLYKLGIWLAEFDFK